MRADVLCIAKARSSSIAAMILISVRVSPSQAQDIDQYCKQHAGLSRSAAVRDLAAQQLRYQKWVDQRKARNLPPFPVNRLPQYKPPSPELAADIAGQLCEHYGPVSDGVVSRYLAGSRE